jgi:hypothetical protein
MTTISNRAVEAVITGTATKDRPARIAELEKQLAKVRKDIAEQEKFEKWLATVRRAFDKLKAEMGKTLTREEYQAIDGVYIFLHNGNVDMVRSIPSATDKGEGTKYLEKLDTGEALEELNHLLK